MTKIKKLDSAVISKRLKISKAQQTMLAAVGVASIMLGVAIILSIHFIKYINFNSKVIAAKDVSIKNYSSVISTSGACKKPKSSDVYSVDELKKCDPNSIDVEEVPNSLKYKALVEVASNASLESVARSNTLSVCKNPTTGNKYTYDELLESYQDATTESDRSYYLSAIKACSALRVIPDALPMTANNEALLASLNQIFLISGWLPETLAPSADNFASGDSDSSIATIPVGLRIEAGNSQTLTVLSNIEKSIREFSVTSAKIEWASGDQLNINAQANAYHMGKVGLTESTTTIKASNSAKKGL